jgi:hypothetical protein
MLCPPSPTGVWVDQDETKFNDEEDKVPNPELPPLDTVLCVKIWPKE